MRRKVSLALGFGLLLAIGCAGTETRTYILTNPTSAPATWTGRDMDEVIEAWGPPAARQSDGEGGILLIYEDRTGVSASASEGTASPPDLDPNPSLTPAKSQEIKRVKAKFWIDSQRKVYRFWFPSGVYKKGLDTPPAKKPKGEDGEP